MFDIFATKQEKHTQANRRSDALTLFDKERIFGFNTALKDLIMSERRKYLDQLDSNTIRRLWDFTIAIDPHDMFDIAKRYLPEFVSDNTRFLINVGYRRAHIDTLDRDLIETGFFVRDIAFNVADGNTDKQSRAFGFNIEPFIARSQLNGKPNDIYVDKYVRNPTKVNMSMNDPFLFHVLADLLNGGDGDCSTLQIPYSKRPFRDLINIPWEELIKDESWPNP